MKKLFSLFVILAVSLNLCAQDTEELQELREKQKFWLGFTIASGIGLFCTIIGAIQNKVKQNELEAEVSKCEAEKKKLTAELFECKWKLNENTQQKTCPYCAELIKNEAIVCRYCGRDLIKESDVKKDTETRKDSLIVNEQDLPIKEEEK